MDTSRTVFKGTLVLSKVILISLLLVYSYRNVYTEFIVANPKKFLNESIILGAITSIPMTMLLLVRYGGFTIPLGIAVVTFMSFFFTNVIMEMSGQNAITYSDLGTELPVFKKSLSALAIPLVAMAYFIFDTGPGLGIVLFESVIFGIAGTIPAVIASKNRGKPLSTNNIMGHFLLFGFSQFILQLGGFYTYK